MKNVKRATILISCMLVLAPLGIVQAVTVYQYAGNNYEVINPGTLYDTSMSVTGSFTVDAPLISFNGDARSLITEFRYFDGINTLTEVKSNASFFLTTDSIGNITDWDIDIDNADRIVTGDPFYRISSSNFYDAGTTGECGIDDSTGCVVVEIQEQGLVVENPGAWTTVPKYKPMPWLHLLLE